MAVVVEGNGNDPECNEDTDQGEESDGGSLDDTPDEPSPRLPVANRVLNTAALIAAKLGPAEARPKTAVAAVQFAPSPPRSPVAQRRPHTAPSLGEQPAGALREGSLVVALGPRAALSRLPPPDDPQRLLLSGGLWGRAGSQGSLIHDTRGDADAVREVAAGAKPVLSPSSAKVVLAPKNGAKATLPQPAGEKLPRQCVFMDNVSKGATQGRVGGSSCLAPGAARMRSHISWVSFLPMPHNGQGFGGQPLGRNNDAGKKLRLKPRTTTVASSSSSGPPANVARPEAMTAVLPASTVVAAQANSSEVVEMTQPVAPGSRPDADALPVSEPPAEVPHRPDNEPKRKGPKYHVRPGGSRPTQAPQSKAPTREFVVLEFRTEPRVVPASRGREEKEKAKGAHNMLRFRPDARRKATEHQWVAEREALAAAAKAR